MKMQVLQNLVMRAESRFWMAPNWPEIRKNDNDVQFSDMTLSSNLLTLFCFSFEV